MSDRVLKSKSEPNLFQENIELPEEFWSRYFTIQRTVEEVDLMDGRFTVKFTNSQGKTKQYKNVRFSDGQSNFRPNN